MQISTKEKLQDDITDQLTAVTKKMLVMNSPEFNLRTEQEIQRIAKDIDVFGENFGKEDSVYKRFCLLVGVLLDKLENRRLMNTL